MKLNKIAGAATHKIKGAFRNIIEAFKQEYSGSMFRLLSAIIPSMALIETLGIYAGIIPLLVASIALELILGRFFFSHIWERVALYILAWATGYVFAALSAAGMFLIALLMVLLFVELGRIVERREEQLRHSHS